MADAIVTTQAVIDSNPAKLGAQAFNDALASMRDGVVKTGQSLDKFTGIASTVRGAFVAMAGAIAAKGIIDAMDDYTRLKVRLEGVTGSAEAGAAALAKIKAAAKDSRTPSADLADAFGKIAGTLKENNLTQDDAIRSFALLSKSMQLGGATTDQVKGALDALSRSFAAGRFEGRQFITLMEDAPLLMQKLQAATGLSAKQLRAWALDGKITGATVVSLLNSVADEVDAKFKAMPRTVGGSVQQVASALTGTLGAAFSDNGRAANVFIGIMDDVRDVFRSDDFKALVRSVADSFGWLAEKIRDGVKALNDFHRSRYAIDFAEGARQESANPLEFPWVGGPQTPQKSINPFSFGGKLKDMPGDILKGVSDAATNPWKTTVDAAKAAPGAVQFGEGLQEREFEKAIELERLQRELLQAQATDDKARVAAIQEELLVRQKITPAIKDNYPALASQLEAQIRVTEETKRQMQIYAENKAIAGSAFDAVTNGITSGIKAGDSFIQTLRNIAASLVEIVAKAALLAPLKTLFSNSAGGALTSAGFNPEVGLLGGLFGGSLSTVAASAANGGWQTTTQSAGLLSSLFGFADGGSFQVGGSGGTDSQLVAFRASPDETVTVRRPDQQNSGGQSSVVNVSFNVAGDATEDTLAKMRQMAQQVFAQNSPQLIRSSVDAVAQRNLNDRNYLKR